MYVVYFPDLCWMNGNELAVPCHFLFPKCWGSLVCIYFIHISNHRAENNYLFSLLYAEIQEAFGILLSHIYDILDTNLPRYIMLFKMVTFGMIFESCQLKVNSWVYSLHNQVGARSKQQSAKVGFLGDLFFLSRLRGPNLNTCLNIKMFFLKLNTK